MKSFGWEGLSTNIRLSMKNIMKNIITNIMELYEISIFN